MSAATGGWRVALRLARREAWRRKAQSLLMLALICLPVAAVTAAAVVWRTSDVSAAESVERRMGAADALVEATDSERVVQAFDPLDVSSWVGEERRDPLPLARLRAALGEDRPVTPIAREWLFFETDRGAADAEVVVADLADPLTDGLFRPVEGSTHPVPARSSSTARSPSADRDSATP
ncbi:hypothetical protein [Nocardioides sp. TF02-7]|uniref:hypothetical protein n=1 Tax=Nocardioides sp. TF02-7 TaxID=2917724 RepID=UPI001F061B28|nr:hypothetical protein [Nocardioides sp. TF02-7]UMG94048.1 hypothetical protein MF408_08345 [Nocardioides sp. TF02-7]